MFFLIFISLFSQAGMKSVMSGMHGDKMAVSYEVLNNGKHVIVINEFMGREGKHSKFKQLEVIELGTMEGKELSPQGPCKCFINNEPGFTYAVINTKNSCKTKSINPLKAWSIDQTDMKLIPVKDMKTVNCKWQPDGD